MSKKFSIGCSNAINIFCGLGVRLERTWTVLKAHLICCDPLVVGLSNNLKGEKISIFCSNKSGKWRKMTHHFWPSGFNLKLRPEGDVNDAGLFINNNNSYEIGKKTDKGRGFQKWNPFFWQTSMPSDCPPKQHFETFQTEEVILIIWFQNKLALGISLILNRAYFSQKILILSL